MQFRLPIDWLNSVIPIKESPSELAALLSTHGPSVDRIISARHEFTNVVVGHIRSIMPHPDAERLQVARVEIGKGKTADIVCGAPNIAAGQKVPVALPGATLPGGLVIERRAVRGVVSEGMLCSARELGIHDDHVGILILSADETVGKQLTAIGTLSDTILDIEPTTNRPDVASVIGVAREVAAITGRPLRWRAPKSLVTGKRSGVTVRVEDKAGCKRFMAVSLKNVSVGPSPWWLQERLVRAGLRPINNIVDVTNYVMLELGHPLHVFDAKVTGTTLIVRRAKKGESLQALDGKTYQLTTHDLVVANKARVLSLAGVMGGVESGVSSETVDVILEAATWEPVGIRRTSRQLQLSSDAQKLFEKGLSSEAPPLALARAAQLIRELAGGTGTMATDWRQKTYQPRRITVSTVAVSRLLGITLSVAVIRRYLTQLGFAVRGNGQTLSVIVPYWRDGDVVATEDIIEEIARLHGYEKFRSIVPTADVMSRAGGQVFQREHALKQSLAGLGYTEIYSYALVSEALIRAAGEQPATVLAVANPLNSDLTYLRPNLLPSLLAVLERNGAYSSSLRLFEMAKIYTPGSGKKGLDAYRSESLRCAAVLTDGTLSPQQLFQEAKGVLESLVQEAGLSDETVQWQSGADHPFLGSRSVTLRIADRVVGSVGILDPMFTKIIGLSGIVAGIDADAAFLSSTVSRRPYQAVAKFPVVKRDISLVVPRNVRYTDVVAAMQKASPLLVGIELFDTYTGRQIGEGMTSYNVHLTFRAADRTLSVEEVATAWSALEAAIRNNNVTIRS